MRDECVHGSLRRQCEICSRDEYISELKAALRPFGDAYRFTKQMGSMRREYEASMTCTGKFTVADLHRAAELTKE